MDTNELRTFSNVSSSPFVTTSMRSSPWGFRASWQRRIPAWKGSSFMSSLAIPAHWEPMPEKTYQTGLFSWFHCYTKIQKLETLPFFALTTLSHHDFGHFLVCADHGVATELVALNVLRVDVGDKCDKFRVSLVLFNLLEEFLDGLLGAAGHSHNGRTGHQGGGGRFWLGVGFQNDVSVGTAKAK